MTPNRAKILDKAKKLKALADRGVDGEMESAKNMLTKYMEKHNITLKEIENHKFSVDSIFSGMSDSEFLNEIGKDLLVFGIGFVICSFFGKKAAMDYKDLSLSELNKKYINELNRRKR